MIDIEAVIKAALRPVLDELRSLGAEFVSLAARVERVEDKACIAAREAVAASLAEATLKIERAVNGVRNGADGRDGADGVGIEALAQVDSYELEIEFTNGERVLVALPKGEAGAPGNQGQPGAPGIGHDAPTWLPGVHRQGVLVQHHIGRIYRAVNDTAAEPGDSTDWQRVGSHGFRWCGPIDKARVYECGDLYVDGGTFLVLDHEVRHCIAGKPLAPSDVRAIVARELSPCRDELKALRAGLDEEFAQRKVLQLERDALMKDIVSARSERVAMSSQLVQIAQRVEELSRFVVDSQTR